MISKESFSKEHILSVWKETGSDPSILQRTIFAFGLLEALYKTGLSFIFKGGTCLIILLDTPRRLSTDIDIVVPAGTDIDRYINEAGKLFPFLGFEEDFRKKSGKIEKRHFYFKFESPLQKKIITVVLDVVFENDPYLKTDKKPIENDLLITEGEPIFVHVPDKNCILADKLTAFAPRTTGIPFGVNKELEIVKQFYDCWTLLSEMDDYDMVKRAYGRLVSIEMNYRNLSMAQTDVLMDTILSCIELIGRGSIGNNYPKYQKGIDAIGLHIFNGNLSGETVGGKACEVMYLAACMMTDEPYEKPDVEAYQKKKLTIKGAKRITYMKNTHPNGYACLLKTFEILEAKGILLEDILKYS